MSLDGTGFERSSLHARLGQACPVSPRDLHKDSGGKVMSNVPYRIETLCHRTMLPAWY